MQRIKFAVNLIQAIALVIGYSHFASADTNNTPLKKLLNDKGFMMAVSPDDIKYVGGFLLVVKGGQPTFVPLAKGMTRPGASPKNVIFYSQTGKSSFSLDAVVTGMKALIGGDPGASISKTSSGNVNQIDATSDYIDQGTTRDVAVDRRCSEQIEKWLADKRIEQVFILNQLLYAKHIKITSASGFGLGVSYSGSPVPKCSAAESKSNSKDASSSSTSTYSSTKSMKPKTVAKDTTSKKSTASSTTPKTAGAASGDLGGELHLCYSNEKTVALNTDKHVSFAGKGFLIHKVNGQTVMDDYNSVAHKNEMFRVVDPSSLGLQAPENLTLLQYNSNAGEQMKQVEAIPAAQWKTVEWPGPFKY